MVVVVLLAVVVALGPSLILKRIFVARFLPYQVRAFSAPSLLPPQEIMLFVQMFPKPKIK